MKKIVFASTLILSTLFANSQYDLGIGIGRNNVSNSPMDNYNFLNLRIGKYLPKNHILRFELERSEDLFDLSDSLTRALVNVEHYFDVQSKDFTPYAFVGAGYQWVGGNYDDNIVADLGVGIKYALNKTMNLFAEIRGLRDFGNNDNHYGAILGVNYAFGKKEETKVVEPVNEPKVIDSDNDGVSDDKDLCPNTPAGVEVNKNGCPVDSDNDGVADFLDKCPNTPAGVKVNVDGCPVDSDNDGVADYMDKCPHTPAGVKVDNNGCALTYNFDITFDNDSAVIKPEFMKKIEEFAQFLKQNPGVKAEIQGYTDSRGSYKHNMVLSEKRAKAVYEALIKLGVSKDRLSFAGYGPNNPIASNDTAQGRSKNRRVVAKIYY